MRPTTPTGGSSSGPVVVDGWTCPLPLRDYDRITLAHGGGGVITSELIEHLFLPAFGDAAADAGLHDAAVLPIDGGRLAFTTDSYVVQPLFFPGGCIGDLAVNGTVNDLAMSGAVPLALSTAFVLEEGLELEVLGRVATAMGAAASRASVRMLTGDTKVVEAGAADGMYITTSGVGVVPDGVDIGPHRARPGDVVIVSGPIGQHGTAILSVREGLEFGTSLGSDTMALGGLVGAMIATGADLHVLRDPTRGGLAGVLGEVAEAAQVGISYDETALPVPAEVRAACAFLGLDPVHMANEGRLVAIVAASDADRVVAAMRAHPGGRSAVVIGKVEDRHPGFVWSRTALGAEVFVDRPLGEQLPRIC